MTFVFVSCQTSPKATPGASKTGKPIAPGSINLNGIWKGTSKWSTESDGGTDRVKLEIVQKSTQITIINSSQGSGFKASGTLEGNIIHMKPVSFISETGSKIRLPNRELYISRDGNTLTTEFYWTWESGSFDGRGKSKVTVTRE